MAKVKEKKALPGRRKGGNMYVVLSDGEIVGYRQTRGQARKLAKKYKEWEIYNNHTEEFIEDSEQQP